MKRSRLVLFPLSVVVSAGLLAGCGGGGSESTSSGSATSSAAASESAASDAVEPAAAGDTVAGEALATRMLDALQASRTMRVTNEGVGGAGGSTSEVVYEDGSASSRTTTDLGGSTMEVIFLNNGEAVFIKAPSAGLADWTKVEAGSTNPVVQAMATQLEQMKDQLDPAAGIQLYAQAGEFTVVGTEQVDGVEATKYTGSLPVDALVSSMGAQGEAVKAQLGTEPIPLEIFLDDKDRPVKVVVTMTLAGQTLTNTTLYSDFGADITVTAP